MKLQSNRAKITTLLLSFVCICAVQTKQSVTRLKDMNDQQIEEKFGITPKQLDKSSKEGYGVLFNSHEYYRDLGTESNLKGIVGQYPVFMDRLYLTGDWMASGTGSTPASQFNKFSNQYGEYDCAFIQDIYNSNYLIFQAIDGHYIDNPTVEALLNLSDAVSTFDVTNTTFTLNSKFFVKINRQKLL